MDLHVTLDPAGELTGQLYDQLRAAVLDGRLAPGDRVPSTRELATTLGVSRGTVATAYDRLVAEEFLTGRTGAGTFVSGACRADAARAGARRARGGAVLPVGPWRTPGSAEVVGPPPVPVTHDFSLGVPDPDLFPLPVWRRLVAAQLRRGRFGRGTYDDGGEPATLRLQEQVARRVGLARSVVAAGEDVVVTAGAQQALDLVARVLVEPGTVVAVEDPGYTAAHRLFETHRADVRGVPVDADGLVVDALPQGARLVYVTPSHQFPTGVPMSLARRTALLEWASRNDAVVVEDDYDSEFRYADRPLEPLQSLDRDGRVVHVGSFSKSLLPALRVGFVVAPRSLTPALRDALRVTAWAGDALTHGALADFLAEGHHAAHVRRATRVYGERRTVLLREIEERLGDRVAVAPTAAGLHVCALLRDQRVDDRAVVAAAGRLGVRVDALSTRYRDAAPRQGLALGLGGVPVEAVPEGVARLARALDAVVSG